MLVALLSLVQGENPQCDSSERPGNLPRVCRQIPDWSRRESLWIPVYSTSHRRNETRCELWVPVNTNDLYR